MDLNIRAYCTITPGEVRLNNQTMTTIAKQESLDKSLAQTYRDLGMEYLKFFKMDNLSKLSMLATECLLKGTELYGAADNEDVAVVLSNASSSLVTDINYQHTINDKENYFPSPSLFVYTLPNISIGEICIKHKIYGENIFFVSEKYDAKNVHFYVSELFKCSNTKHCITGWVECNENSYEAFFILVEHGGNGEAFTMNKINTLYNFK